MRSQPLYRQVKEQIIESLARNQWRPGELIPSEKQLAARFGVGVSTVRAAIGELAIARVLIRTQGKGTYVAHHNARGSAYRFFNVVSNKGVKEPFHRELLSIRREHANSAVASRLQLSSRALVHRLKIRLSASFPRFAYAEIVVPSRLFPGLGAHAVPDGAASLYALYQARYGVNIVRVDENFYAVRAGSVVSRALDLARDDPVLQIDRIGYTFNDTPVELRTTWVRTTHYHYFMTQGAAG
jgi:GntR family transcriptional regulator